MPISTSPWKNDFRLFAVDYFPDGVSQQVFSGITQGDIQANTEILKEVTAGQLYPEAAILQTFRPVASFTSFNLEQLLDTIGVGAGPANCIHSDTNPGVDLWFTRQSCAGPDLTTPAVPDTHIKYNVGEGIIVPTTLTVDHRGNATLGYQIFASEDAAGNAPIIKDHQPSIPVPTLANANLRWTMDRFDIGGVQCWGKRNITINFNASVTQEGADSNPTDSVASLDNMQPRVTIQGVDPNWFADADGANDGLTASTQPFGKQVVKADTVLYFKERVSDGGAGTWISMAFDGLLTFDTLVTGDPQSPAQIVAVIDVVKKDSGDPITVTTGGNAPT